MREQSYRLATYVRGNDEPRAGIVVDDALLDVSALLAKRVEKSSGSSPTQVLQVLEKWQQLHPLLQQAACDARSGKSGAHATPARDVRFLAPILYPGTIFCAGANYRDHVAEMSKAMNLPPEPDPHEAGLKPWHFIKAAGTITGPGATIKAADYAKELDWEIELAAVIGRPCKDVPEEKALNYVAGYVASNDLSARDRGRRPGIEPTSFFKMDWSKHKSFDGSCPIGPWITPASDIDDPQQLALKLWVNDSLKQDSNSSKMLFSLAEQIEQLAINMTLHPGDIILTGTPAGTGAESGEFLKAGDVVKVWIEGIGEFSNKIA